MGFNKKTKGSTEDNGSTETPQIQAAVHIITHDHAMASSDNLLNCKNKAKLNDSKYALFSGDTTTRELNAATHRTELD